MMNRVYSIMVAISQNGVIASKSGELPFNIPEDKEYYLNVIKDRVWIQARKSFENGPSEKLKTKHNFVLTRNPDFHPSTSNTTIVNSLEQALDKSHEITNENEEIFIGGGMSLYADALSFADKLYITRVHKAYTDTGAFFPAFDWKQWECLSSDSRRSETGIDFSIEVYQRRK